MTPPFINLLASMEHFVVNTYVRRYDHGLHLLSHFSDTRRRRIFSSHMQATGWWLLDS